MLQLAHHTPRLTLVGRRPEPLEEVAQLVRARGGQAHVVQAVAAATVAGMVDGSLTVVRGGESRAQMIDLNRNDPAAVDQFLAGRKPELEQAVAGHSIL